MPSSFADFFFTYQTLIYSVGINGLLAISMYAVLAVGQLSLGQAAFMGIGAYASGLIVRAGAPIEVGLLASILSPSLIAFIVGGPTLRLSGLYLALATIGLGEVLRVSLVNSDFAGGALGLSGIPTLGDYSALWIIYGALGVALLAGFFLLRSRIGRTMDAMREDETAAGASGVDLPRARLTALLVSAALAGFAGALNAHVTSFIGPNDYGFDEAVNILSYALLGGVASPLGPVLGATLLTLAPEVLRPLHDYRSVVDGGAIVIAVLFMPRGLLPWRPSRIGVRVPKP